MHQLFRHGTSCNIFSEPGRSGPNNPHTLSQASLHVAGVRSRPLDKCGDCASCAFPGSRSCLRMAPSPAGGCVPLLDSTIVEPPVSQKSSSSSPKDKRCRLAPPIGLFSSSSPSLSVVLCRRLRFASSLASLSASSRARWPLSS